MALVSQSGISDDLIDMYSGNRALFPKAYDDFRLLDETLSIEQAEDEIITLFDTGAFERTPRI